MEKYRFRRVVLSTLIILIPHLFFSLSISLLIGALLQWIVVVITWTDYYDRFWIARYFDPKI